MSITAPQRVLLKLSGEALMGNDAFGINAEILGQTAQVIKDIVEKNIQVALVVGGGNIFRGVNLQASGIERVTGDQMGMLATVMNGLALQDALKKININAQVMSALRIDGICEHYSSRQAIQHLESGKVVIFVAGTGNPLFTTDSAASLRAIEIKADLMIKATKVDGVYDADPVKNPHATKFTTLSYDETITRRLAVMDMTAVLLCREHNMPLQVLNMGKPGALLRAVMGQNEGTLIHA
jgi:uridylate kinase